MRGACTKLIALHVFFLAQGANAVSKTIKLQSTESLPEPGTPVAPDGVSYALLYPSLLQPLSHGGWGDVSASGPTSPSNTAVLLLMFASVFVLVCVALKAFPHVFRLVTTQLKLLDDDERFFVGSPDPLKTYLQSIHPAKGVKPRRILPHNVQRRASQVASLPFASEAAPILGGKASVRVCFARRNYPPRQQTGDYLAGGFPQASTFVPVDEADEVKSDFETTGEVARTAKRLDIEPATLTYWETVATLANFFVGIGLLTLPRALALGGAVMTAATWFLSFLMFATGACLLAATQDMEVAAMVSDETEWSTILSGGYLEVCRWSMGRFGAVGAAFLLYLEFISGAGVLVASMWDTCDQISDSAPMAYGLTIVSTILLMAAIFCAGNWRGIAWTSIVALMAWGGLTLVVMSLAWESGHASEQSGPSNVGEARGNNEVDNGLSALALILLAHGGGGPVSMSVRGRMRNPKKFSKALGMALAIAGIIAAALVAAFHLHYGQASDVLLTTSLSNGSSSPGTRFAVALGGIGAGCTASALLLYLSEQVFVVPLLCANRMVRTESVKKSNFASMIAARVSVMMPSFIIAAIAYGRVEMLLSTLGLLCVPVTAIALPSVMFLKESWPYEEGVWRIIPLLMLVSVALLLVVLVAVSWLKLLEAV